MAKKKPQPGLADVQAFVEAIKDHVADVFVGIDPGANGGIAFLCGKRACVVSIPVVEVARVRTVKIKRPKGYVRQKGDKKTKTVHGKTTKFVLKDICKLFKALRPVRRRVHTAVEVAAASRKGGGANNLRIAHMTGAGFGMWPLFLCSKGFKRKPLEIRSQEWKKELKLIGEDKTASRALAAKLWPKLKATMTRVKDDGRAEALLIAEALRRKRLKETKA